MAYRKCPKCDLNYITDDEELCSVCSPNTPFNIILICLSTGAI